MYLNYSTWESSEERDKRLLEKEISVAPTVYLCPIHYCSHRIWEVFRSASLCWNQLCSNDGKIKLRLKGMAVHLQSYFNKPANLSLLWWLQHKNPALNTCPGKLSLLYLTLPQVRCSVGWSPGLDWCAHFVFLTVHVAWLTATCASSWFMW